MVPKEVREALGIKPGTKLYWVMKGDTAVVFAVPNDPVRALRGILKGRGSYEMWLQERNEERKRERTTEAEEEGHWQGTSSTPRP